MYAEQASSTKCAIWKVTRCSIIALIGRTVSLALLPRAFGSMAASKRRAIVSKWGTAAADEMAEMLYSEVQQLRH